jgi:hypothetical protein
MEGKEVFIAAEFSGEWDDRYKYKGAEAPLPAAVSILPDSGVDCGFD